MTRSEHRERKAEDARRRNEALLQARLDERLAEQQRKWRELQSRAHATSWVLTEDDQHFRESER